MSDQQMDPVENEDEGEGEGEGERSKDERRKAQRRQGNDVEYLKHEGNRRRADRRRSGGNETIDHTLTNMLGKGPDMDKVIKIVFTRVLFVIAMAVLLYHVAVYFIFPQNLFKRSFGDVNKTESINR